MNILDLKAQKQSEHEKMRARLKKLETLIHFLPRFFIMADGSTGDLEINYHSLLLLPEYQKEWNPAEAQLEISVSNARQAFDLISYKFPPCQLFLQSDQNPAFIPILPNLASRYPKESRIGSVRFMKDIGLSGERGWYLQWFAEMKGTESEMIDIKCFIRDQKHFPVIMQSDSRIVFGNFPAHGRAVIDSARPECAYIVIWPITADLTMAFSQKTDIDIERHGMNFNGR